MRSFVIVVDMQRDFVEASGALPVPDAEAIVAPMQQWLAALTPAETAGDLCRLQRGPAVSDPL